MALTGDLVRQGHVTLKVTLSISACIHATAMIFFYTFSLQESQCCSMYTSRDRKCHFQGHVTLTYKVTRQGHDIRLYAIDFSELKNLRNKKNHCCSMYTSRDRKCHFQGHVTLTYKVTRQGHDIRLYSIDFPEVKSIETKKNHCCSMYTSRDRKCHF